MRNSIRLSDLPADLQSTIQATKMNTEHGLSVIENGIWNDTGVSNYQMKQDVFYYQGTYWKHVKWRTNMADVNEEFTDDSVLTQVFPQTKQVVVYL